VLTTTVLITTLVVCVAAINSYIYLAPEPDAPVVAAALATPRQPKSTETPPPPTPATDYPSSLPFVPAVTPTPPPGASSPPGANTNPSGPTTPSDTSTPTDKTTPTPTPVTTETPVVTETPRMEQTPPPPPRTPTPTPTPTVVVEAQPPPPPPPAPKCTGDIKGQLRGEIFARSQAAWEEAIGGERDAVVRANAPAGAARTSIGLFGPVVYSVKFSKTCEPVSVTAVYVWRVRWAEAPAPDQGGRPPSVRRDGFGAPGRDSNRNQRQEPNRDERPASTGGERRVLRTKSFGCANDGAGWRCG
jgi:hypothetical protein